MRRAARLCQSKEVMLLRMATVALLLGLSAGCGQTVKCVCTGGGPVPIPTSSATH